MVAMTNLGFAYDQDSDSLILSNNDLARKLHQLFLIKIF